MKERFKFNTVGLFTRDNKATVDFYTKTFGFTTDWDGIQPNVEMTLGNMRIILFPRDAFEHMVSREFQYPEGFNGTVELAFDVPTFADVDKEYQHALTNGAASVLSPTTNSTYRRMPFVTKCCNSSQKWGGLQLFYACVASNWKTFNNLKNEKDQFENGSYDSCNDDVFNSRCYD